MNPRRAVPRNLLIPGGKLTGYLFDGAHPRGASKAKFFLGHGFRQSEPRILAEVILAHIADPDTEISFVREAILEKMVCEGPLPTPKGSRTRIRSVWVRDADDAARLVTAVPAMPNRTRRGT